ncbi:hypothetical protein GE21DRAFT_1068877 [Neurospora crassa]|nr:hypothetical protein GE21DRAFT_1068877 [Neurospora crassa]
MHFAWSMFMFGMMLSLIRLPRPAVTPTYLAAEDKNLIGLNRGLRGGGQLQIRLMTAGMGWLFREDEPRNRYGCGAKFSAAPPPVRACLPTHLLPM